MTKLDLTKPVQTRGGRPVRILCMDQLGDVRKKGCGHCSRVHGKLADAIRALPLPNEDAK